MVRVSSLFWEVIRRKPFNAENYYMEQTPLQGQVQSSIPSSTQQSPPPKPSSIARNVISVSAAVLGASFFMPWANFLGGNLSGLELQKHLESYKLVWLLPACAAITLILNIAGAPTALVRRIAGGVPFAILAYSLNKLGSDLFQILSWGGWVALAAGIILIVASSPAKPQSKA
jgi:hypothetical protein